MSVRTVKNKPFIYGLTGGIASGKSTASNFFVSKNVKVIDSDKIVKDLWENNNELKEIVFNKYQIKINTKEGKKALRNIIFNNEEELKYINSVIHPLVFIEVDKLIKKYQDELFIVIDMPLLFEVNYIKVDKVILIYVNRETQIKRLVSRDNISKSEALNIINNQMSLEIKKELSDIVINNNGSLNDLNNNLLKLYEEIVNENK